MSTAAPDLARRPFAYRAAARIAIAVVLLAYAALITRRAWEAADNVFADYKDSPDGLYLSNGAIMFSVALVIAAVAVVIAWPSARRYSYLVIACVALTASFLPALLFKWSSRPDNWPWVWLADNDFDFGWLRLERGDGHWNYWTYWDAPHRVGLAFQLLLAAVAIAAVVQYLRLRRRDRSPAR
jgi:hypothetical protein